MKRHRWFDWFGRRLLLPPPCNKPALESNSAGALGDGFQDEVRAIREPLQIRLRRHAAQHQHRLDLIEARARLGEPLNDNLVDGTSRKRTLEDFYKRAEKIRLHDGSPKKSEAISRQRVT